MPKQEINSLELRKTWFYDHDCSSFFLCFLSHPTLPPNNYISNIVITAVLPQFSPDSHYWRREKQKVLNKNKISWSPLLKMVLLTKTVVINQIFRKLVREQIYTQNVYIFPIKMILSLHLKNK